LRIRTTLAMKCFAMRITPTSSSSSLGPGPVWLETRSLLSPQEESGLLTMLTMLEYSRRRLQKDPLTLHLAKLGNERTICGKKTNRMSLVSPVPKTDWKFCERCSERNSPKL